MKQNWNFWNFTSALKETWGVFALIWLIKSVGITAAALSNITVCLRKLVLLKEIESSTDYIQNTQLFVQYKDNNGHFF